MLKRYIQENRKSIFITVVFTVALYAVMLLGNRISIDTEVMINNPEGQLNAWYGINRFGLGLFKHVFHLIPISIPFTNVMTVLFFIFAAISWNYSLVTLQKVQNTKAVFVFLLIFVSSPIFAEQFHFTLQSMEIAFALGAEKGHLSCHSCSSFTGLLFFLLSGLCFSVCVCLPSVVPYPSGGERNFGKRTGGGNFQIHFGASGSFCAV